MSRRLTVALPLDEPMDSEGYVVFFQPVDNSVTKSDQLGWHLSIPLESWQRIGQPDAVALVVTNGAVYDEPRCEDAMNAVVALHKREWGGRGEDPGGTAGGAYCGHCSKLKMDYVPWPCETRAVIAREA